MSEDSTPNDVPRTAEVDAARAALEAASDVLDRMPNVDPFVVRKLRELSDELLASRTTHLDRIITWVPDDLKDLYGEISYGATRQGPATILRQLERFEVVAPHHDTEDGRFFVMFPDPRIEWIESARDPEQVGNYPGELGIYPAVFDAVERRCREHYDLTLPEIARLMREQVTYYARLLGAVDDFDEWLHTELPRLELERTVPRYPCPTVPDDLAKLIDDRLEEEPETNKVAHLQRLRREVEAWMAALESWWGERRDPKDTVHKVCDQFDQPPPPGWERNIITSAEGMQVEATDEFLEQLEHFADELGEGASEQGETDISDPEQT